MTYADVQKAYRLHNTIIFQSEYVEIPLRKYHRSIWNINFVMHTWDRGEVS